MKRVVLMAGLLLGVLTSTYGAGEKVDVMGVMESKKGPAAVINGTLYRVNDSVAGGKITAITLSGVTILKDGKKTVYIVKGSEGSTKASASKEKSTGASGWFKSLRKK